VLTRERLTVDHTHPPNGTTYVPTYTLVQRSSIVAVVNLFIVAFFVTASGRGQ
jgi:hypothetical protein